MGLPPSPSCPLHVARLPVTSESSQVRVGGFLNTGPVFPSPELTCTCEEPRRAT